jgi:pimeloyl-ACP methyl ester carboxylesterase
MRKRRAFNSVLRIGAILLVCYLGIVAMTYFRQRSLLFFPTHNTTPTELSPWSDGSQTIGFCRESPHPHAIWLMMHGNGGQAADRDYVLRCMSAQDSLYVLEYPGYGSREGIPTMKSINDAASEAYRLLRSRNPNTPVCVLGESLGSGPACALALEKTPPDKIVLVVPYDTLPNAAARHFPFIPVRLLIRYTWDNVAVLKHYGGPVEIFDAVNDTIIPIDHARSLAKQIPGARFAEISGGHNDWSSSDKVKIKL